MWLINVRYRAGFHRAQARNAILARRQRLAYCYLDHVVRPIWRLVATWMHSASIERFDEGFYSIVDRQQTLLVHVEFACDPDEFARSSFSDLPHARSCFTQLDRPDPRLYDAVAIVMELLRREACFVRKDSESGGHRAGGCDAPAVAGVDGVRINT